MVIKSCIKKDTKGILLIEVLLGVVIISVSLTMIIASLMTSIRASVFSEDYSRAAIILDNLFFDLMVTPDPFFLSSSLGEDCGQPFDGYQCHITTEDSFELFGQEALEGLNKVSATVSWPSGMNRKEISSQTLVLTPE